MPQLTAEQIAQAATDHEDETRYGAQGTTTKCNFFVRDVVQSLLGQSRPELSAQANQQFEGMSNSPGWEKQNFSSAREDQV